MKSLKSFNKRKAHKPEFFVDMYCKTVSTNVKGGETAMSYQFEKALERKLNSLGFYPIEMKQTIELKSLHRKNKNNHKAVTLPAAFIADLQVPLGMLSGRVHCG